MVVPTVDDDDLAPNSMWLRSCQWDGCRESSLS